ncbi:hypothetical protein P5673_001874 [Acropora cervicornis]|uniref:Uncharacterized protein n=1 Tax=Acropora cervicornis TaxID=6130 RepID=A0AAD9R4T8_ACRCE|nr:hypothetical protein P5673_001874 [Acropora cervicornis]
MTLLTLKITILVLCLCVYVCGIKGRPNSNLDDETVMNDQRNFEETDLFRRSKTRGGGGDKGHTGVKGKKKQVIDAYHLGPYHHGHPWGTVSQWPGYHWGGHVGYHGGWTGYPSLGGWHKSHISKMSSKKSVSKGALKRQYLPTFAFPAYGLAYPSVGFATVPIAPAPLPWGYAFYRSRVPDQSEKGQTRSSVKGSKADKRWWPGYMGGWGGWGIGNRGYPGWGPADDVWGHGFDAAGLGLGWGFGFGNVFHPYMRSEVPGKQSKRDKAEKRWWPGYMGGWGGWGLGNTGYPGWGPLGTDLAFGVSPYTYRHGLGPYGYGHGLGLYGYYGRGFGLGYTPALGYHSGAIKKTEGKKEQEEGPKRQFIHEPYGGFGYPGSGYGTGYSYGPFGTFGSPFFGHGAYIPYPASFYDDFVPPHGLVPYGFSKSNIPKKNSKKVSKGEKSEEKATSRQFVANFHPGHYGWGGVIHPGTGYQGQIPLLGAFTYSGFNGRYYGPRGLHRIALSPFYKSNIPEPVEESGQNREVINYHPGCCRWGGCIYPGCGFIGSWTWPLPCHFHHCGHHCCPCWTRSKFPKRQGVKQEKGKSRQDIESPLQDRSDDDDGSKDPKTRPHLEGTDLLNSEMNDLAMGFPGIEHLQIPVGESTNPTTQAYSSQEREESSDSQPSEVPQAESTPDEAGNAGFAGLTPDDDGNGFRISSPQTLMEQQGNQESTAEGLLSNFNINPSQGDPPSEAFGDTGNPNMYSEGQSAETASRRAHIPSQEDETVTKKQVVAYPFSSLYPGYMMAHAVNPLYRYTPINYVRYLSD